MSDLATLQLIQADIEGAADRGVVAPGQDVGAIARGREAARDIGLGVGNRGVRAEGEVARDFGVLGVGIEDRRGVGRGDRAEDEAGGLEGIGKHGVQLRP